MFHSDEEQDQVGISLAAIGGMVHDVTIDKSVLDHTAGAVPHVRIANRAEITKRVDHIASLVGTERFFLKVGEMLYTKGAEVGLQREGILTKSDDERIQAEKILNEPVHSEHHHSERVINPAIGEIVSMMGQIDEFKRIRAQVKQAAIAEKLKPADVDRLDKDIKEFLDDPEVKDSLDKLEKAKQRLETAISVADEMEAENDPRVKEILSANASELIPPDALRYADLSNCVPPFPTSAEEKEKQVLLQREIINGIVEEINRLRERWNDFKTKNPSTAKLVEGVLWLTLTSKLGVFKKFLSIGKTIYDGIKAIPDTIGTNGPDRMTFAIPSGATVTEVLEAAPAIAVEGADAGIITAAAGSILPPDDFTDLSFARKAEGKDHTPRATAKYGKGADWDSLKSVDDPSVQRKIGKINKQAFGGGQLRSDGTYIYKFDRFHQSSKIHLERYEKTAKGWRRCAECDPETGNVIPGSEERLKNSSTNRVIKW
jgi:hypothetical protein